MCWSTTEPPKRLIAEEDIPIFKVCVESSRISDGTVVYSYFKYFPYNINEVYKLNGQILPCNKGNCTEIDRGYHSYLETECKFEEYQPFSRWVVRDKDLRYVCAYEHCAIKVSGYIPKDSEYYVNEQGECVSNSICLTRIETL